MLDKKVMYQYITFLSNNLNRGRESHTKKIAVTITINLSIGFCKIG